MPHRQCDDAEVAVGETVMFKQGQLIRLDDSFKITSRSYLLAGAKVTDSIVQYQGKTLTVDGNLPSSLSRLVPPRAAIAAPNEWIPFVERAIVLGLL